MSEAARGEGGVGKLETFSISKESFSIVGYSSPTRLSSRGILGATHESDEVKSKKAKELPRKFRGLHPLLYMRALCLGAKRRYLPRKKK